MTAQKGKDLLIKLGDGGGPEAFATVAGLRATALGFNAQTVDVTHAESSGQWRELLAGAGVRLASVTGSGIFKDAASDESVRSVFFNREQRNWQIVVPDFGTIEGPFEVAALQYEGVHDGELRMSMTLASAGALSFAAA